MVLVVKSVSTDELLLQLEGSEEILQLLRS